MVCNRFHLTPLPQFGRASSFNQDISSWDVSSVTSMAFMVSFTVVDLGYFGLCSQLCTRFDLTPLQQYSVASAFNQDISSWNVSSVRDMSSMVSFMVVDLICSVF